MTFIFEFYTYGFVLLTLNSRILAFDVQIVTWGVTSPSSSLSALAYTKAPMDSAVILMKNQYKSVFNVTHTYLADNDMQTCMDIFARIDFLASKWYYRQKKPADLHVFIAPGKKL